MVGHTRRKAALIAHCGRHTLAVDDFLERVEHLGTVAQRFTKARRAHRDDHELLQIEVVVGVRAAIDHVHQGHRHLHGARAAKVAVKRQTRLFCRSPRHGHTDGQGGIGTKAAFVVGAVQVDQSAVEKGLLGGV